MYEIIIDTLTREFSTDIININFPETILYIIINFLLGYLSYKIFNLIGEKYTKPKKSTKQLMKFFFLSALYFISSGLFEILTVYYSISLNSKLGLLIQFSIISCVLFYFYIMTRYHLCLSIFHKFSKDKTESLKLYFKEMTIIAIILDLIIFFHLWYTYDVTVIIYNIFLLMGIFLWIVRHKKPNHTKIYTIYFLLLILIFNRMNFMFLDFSYSDIYFIFDSILLVTLVSIYTTIYILINKNKNILEQP